MEKDSKNSNRLARVRYLRNGGYLYISFERLLFGVLGRQKPWNLMVILGKAILGSVLGRLRFRPVPLIRMTLILAASKFLSLRDYLRDFVEASKRMEISRFEGVIGYTSCQRCSNHEAYMRRYISYPRKLFFCNAFGLTSFFSSFDDAIHL